MSSLFPLDASLISAASPWGIPVKVVSETTSSNDELLRLGEFGEQSAPTGTLVFAERQTAGRGQFQRLWASSEPLGLWFSLLLRMEISDSTIPALSSFAAVALAEALAELGFTNMHIKPPNDLYLVGRKVAGILVETRSGKSPFAVVGIGLNVNQRMENFPAALQSLAISLAVASGCPAGRDLDRNEIAAILLRSLGRNERLLRTNPPALLARWNSLVVSPAMPPITK
jgi:BirA family biotin operon repressor/biotin-[acetyl-CoA-carboxylase] ligase